MTQEQKEIKTNTELILWMLKNGNFNEGGFEELKTIIQERRVTMKLDSIINDGLDK